MKREFLSPTLTSDYIDLFVVRSSIIKAPKETLNYFSGTVPFEQLRSYLANSHVLILSSDYEGTPGAVMDAMACGLVPVCTTSREVFKN